VLYCKFNYSKYQEFIMGMLSFIKDAGQKLFGIGEAKAAAVAVAEVPSEENIKAMSDAAGNSIASYIGEMGLNVTGLTVAFDAPSGEATVWGIAADQETKEKVVLCCGNVAGVGSVNDQMSVDQSSEESQYYTVESGDNLSKISKEFYDTPNKYMAIFEANQPMLSHPDKIYPGQLLRIPAEA
jgi:nucleoid-associated protein YgaU